MEVKTRIKNKDKDGTQNGKRLNSVKSNKRPRKILLPFHVECDYFLAIFLLFKVTEQFFSNPFSSKMSKIWILQFINNSVLFHEYM
ncbi:UNVERIFIED_CONTAM: hypothetical protein NCL1_30726 [Trichonephila clavipes]